MRGVKDLRRAIVGGDVQDAENQAESLVQEGMTGREVFDTVVRPAMEGVVAQFGRREVYMPELLISLRAARAALRQAKETWGKNQASSGRVVVGAISPDCQRFCRQVIVDLLDVFGYEIIDLGASVPAAKFADECAASGASLLVLAELAIASERPVSKATIAGIAAIAAEMESRGIRQRTRILWVGFGMENSPCGDQNPDAACDDLAEIPGLVRQLIQRN